MTRRRTPFAVVLPLAAAWWGAAPPAAGQSGFRVEVTYGPGAVCITPNEPTCRVVVSAAFPPNDYAAAGVRLNVVAGEAGWVSTRNLEPMLTGSSPGVIAGGAVNGIVGGQLNFPPANIFADPRNPVPVWEGVWSTVNYTLRNVPLSTRTLRFDVYPSRNSPMSTSRLSGLSEGVGEIIVGCPAPSALSLLGLAAVAAGRRRR